MLTALVKHLDEQIRCTIGHQVLVSKFRRSVNQAYHFDDALDLISALLLLLDVFAEVGERPGGEDGDALRLGLHAGVDEVDGGLLDGPGTPD